MLENINSFDIFDKPKIYSIFPLRHSFEGDILHFRHFNVGKYLWFDLFDTWTVESFFILTFSTFEWWKLLKFYKLWFFSFSTISVHFFENFTRMMEKMCGFAFSTIVLIYIRKIENICDIDILENMGSVDIRVNVIFAVSTLYRWKILTVLTFSTLKL